MASNPHPDHERERFPLPWEDDDTPGLSVHALTRKDMEAILAQMPTSPTRSRRCGCPPCAGRRRHGGNGGRLARQAPPPRPSTGAAAPSSTPPGRAPCPGASPPPCWPG
jgi:hypothetical protein